MCKAILNHLFWVLNLVGQNLCFVGWSPTILLWPSPSFEAIGGLMLWSNPVCYGDCFWIVVVFVHVVPVMWLIWVSKRPLRMLWDPYICKLFVLMCCRLNRRISCSPFLWPPLRLDKFGLSKTTFFKGDPFSAPHVTLLWSLVKVIGRAMSPSL